MRRAQRVSYQKDHVGIGAAFEFEGKGAIDRHRGDEYAIDRRTGRIENRYAHGLEDDIAVPPRLDPNTLGRIPGERHAD